MRLWLALGLLASFLLLSRPPLTAGDKKIQDFYPLQVGNTWHYRLDVGGKQSTLISKIAKSEKADGVDTFILEGSVEGKVIGTEHLRQSDKGIARHKYNGGQIEPPFVILPYPAKPGEKWEGRFRIGADKATFNSSSKEESVEVPAGKFKALRVDIDVVEKGEKAAITYWFVEGTGMVKQHIRTGPLVIDLQLEKFQRGK